MNREIYLKWFVLFEIRMLSRDINLTRRNAAVVRTEKNEGSPDLLLPSITVTTWRGRRCEHGFWSQQTDSSTWCRVLLRRRPWLVAYSGKGPKALLG